MMQAVQTARAFEAAAIGSPKTTVRLRGLDALRGVAALSVVLFHYTTGYEARVNAYPARPFSSFPNSHFGVELFFCISGFVILGTLERTRNGRRFAIARFARIYPAYLACAGLSLATMFLAHFDLSDLNPGVLALNATMLTGLTGVSAIDPSYWTLSYEVLFYAAAGVVWSLLRNRPRLEVPCLVWLACSVIGHLLPWVGRHHRLGVLLNVEYANLFVLGMMLYYLSQGSRTRLTLPTLCVALCLAGFPPEFNGGHLLQTRYVLLICGFCLAIWVVAKSGGRFLDVPPLVFLGDISYSLYLIHQMVGYVAIQNLLRFGVEVNAAIGVTILLVIGIAYLLRIFVERPAERWLKSL